MKVQVKRFLYILITAILCLIVVFCSQASMSVYADTTESIQADYENTNVLDNLQGSTIGGEPFDISDYPHRESGEPQIISFVEFCYSYYADKQSDFGLYVYVYNPQDVVFDMSTDRNKIQFSYGNSYPRNYELEFLNYSTQAGYEGRFYKFKVELSESERSAILNGVEENNRVYKVTSIQLSVDNLVTSYVHAQTYTYSGYAEGYGSELATGDTLTCMVDGFDTYIELDVTHTYYRAKGDYYNGEQSQLNSCYFSVPNKFFEDYGELTEIACEWYEYFTKPILVTEDSYTYNKIDGLHGKDTDTLSTSEYFLFNVFWENSKTSWFSKSGVSDWTSNYGYKIGDSYHWGFLWSSSAEVKYASFPNFAAAFYTGGGSCEDYVVDGDALREKLLLNSTYLGAPYIHGAYSSALFEDYVQSGRTMGYNYKQIKATDKFDIFWNYTTKTLWDRMFTGEQDVDTVHESLDALVQIDDSDLSGSDAEISERLRIAEGDVTGLKLAHERAKARDETVVLFRYSSTKYFCAPAVSSYCSNSNIDGGETLVKNNVELWGDNNFNAYVAQETVYLDFDIISLTYTKDGVDTVIPVVMSPQDVMSGLTPPLEDPFADDMLEWWQILLGLIALIIIIWLLIKFLPAIVYAIGKGLAMIVKAIASLFTSNKSRDKPTSTKYDQYNYSNEEVKNDVYKNSE